MSELFPADTGAGTVVTLPDGLPGFESCARFVVITSPTIEPFTCLQALDGSKPSFLCLDPAAVVGDYRCELSEIDRRRIQFQDEDTLLWLSIVRFDADVARVNLRAPVVINARSMIGLQVIADQSAHAIDHAIPLE